jgi:hypothetical protein
MHVFPPISSAQQWIRNRCRLLLCMSLFWHETDMPTALRDVRSQEQSGKHLLTVSSSQFEPTRTSLRTFDSVSRRRGLLGLGRELDLAAQFQSLCVEN